VELADERVVGSVLEIQRADESFELFSLQTSQEEGRGAGGKGVARDKQVGMNSTGERRNSFKIKRN
jgi:hypothetical protein